MRIDSHIHFWKYNKTRDAWITDEMQILQHDYLPKQLTDELLQNNINGLVAVQADQSEAETFFLTELAKKCRAIKGIVGWVDLQNDDVAERLGFFSQFTLIKGWRHIVQAEPAGFLLKETFLNGVRQLKSFGYTYDLLIHHTQLTEAVKFIEKIPGQKIVIDHCAKPGIRHRDINEWKVLMKTIALNPDVYCKLSGLLTEAAWKEWSAEEFFPYLDVVFDAFGTNRLLFGSDWPVLLLSGTYVQWKNLIEQYMNHFSIEEKEKVFGINTQVFYNL